MSKTFVTNLLLAVCVFLFGANLITAAPVKAAFGRNDRMVYTYLFPWYNWPNPQLPAEEHILRRPANAPAHDYLSVHPAPQTRWFDRNPDYYRRRMPDVSGGPLLSYTNPAWFAAELQSMAANAIDVVAVDCWMFPNQNVPPRSRLAVEQLNAAMTQLDGVGGRYPAVCLFLESKPMGNGKGGGGQVTDLRTEEGAMKLYAAIYDFFWRVGRDRWATIDGKALVILYDADFPGFIAAPYGIRRCKEKFQQDFQTGLAFFGNNGWRALAGGEVDYTCKWGAALRPSRLVETTDLMQISPGYNFLGNTKGCPRDPAAYQRAWESIRRQNKNWISCETWNEWHEGTGIAPSIENGNDFLRITQAQARRFKQRQ